MDQEKPFAETRLADIHKCMTILLPHLEVLGMASATPSCDHPPDIFETVVG